VSINCRFWVSTEGHPDVKILFTSGHTDDALVHDEVGGKRMFFIGKPYTVAGLAYKVRMVLDS